MFKRVWGIIKQNWFNAILIGIMVATIVCLVLSWVFYAKELSWLSNVMISFTCGLLSGLTMYFLTNVRTVKNTKISGYYLRLKDLMGMVNEIKRDAQYYKDNEILWGEEAGVVLRCEKLLDRLDEFQEKIYETPDRLFEQFTGGFDNVLTENVVERIMKEYGEIKDYTDLGEYTQTYMSIIEYMGKAYEIIKPTYDKYRVLYKDSINSWL